MPTDRQQTCKKQGCSNRFSKPQGTRRIYCFECSPEGQAKSNVRYFPESGSNPPNLDENLENQGPLTRKSLKQLEEWGVEDTWQAEAVLTLARQIDSGKGGGSAGVAGAVKAHREAMSVAHAISVVGDGDVIDLIFRENA